MKKLYLLLAFIAFSLNSFAQRTVDIGITVRKISIGNTYAPDTMTANQTLFYDGVTKHYFIVSIKNFGPDSVLKGDTIYTRLAAHKIKGPIFSDSSIIKMIPGGTLSVIPISQINPGSPAFTFTPPLGAPIPYTATITWCDSVWVTAGAGNTAIVDPDMTNNFMCDPVIAKALWAVDVNTVTSTGESLVLYPNPATTRLNVTFDLGGDVKDAKLVLRNVLGQQQYSHQFNNVSGTLMHSADISQLPAGLYTAELHYNDQAVIRKLVIQ